MKLNKIVQICWRSLNLPFLPKLMPPCALCQKREADKTGSHIVPAFMLNSLIGGRNKEIGFMISSSGYIKKYVGREVTGDAIHDILGRDLTDEDIAQNENLFTVDHLLCTQCEKRIGIIESESASIIQTIKENKAQLVKGCSIDFFLEKQNLLLRLLFYSILFRISVAAKYGYNLNPALQERIRKLLDKVASIDADEFKINLQKYRGEITVIPVSIIYAPIEEGSGNQIYSHKPLSIPSLVIINEFILCTYNTMAQINFKFEPVLGMSAKITKEIVNFNERELVVGYLLSRETLNESLTTVVAQKTMRNLANMYREISIGSKGKDPSHREIQGFIDDLVQDETEWADKLEPKFLSKKMFTHLSK